MYESMPINYTHCIEKRIFVDHLRVQFQKIKATKLHYFLYCSSNVNSVTTVRRRHIFSVEKTVREGSSSKSHFSFSPCQPILVKWHNVEKNAPSKPKKHLLPTFNCVCLLGCRYNIAFGACFNPDENTLG